MKNRLKKMLAVVVIGMVFCAGCATTQDRWRSVVFRK